MANVDRPNGFRAVKSISGFPLNNLIRRVGVADGNDIWRGDAISLSGGLAAEGATNDEFLGVAVGFGRVNDLSGKFNLYDPQDLNTPNYYDDSANTHTDWVCYYLPANSCIFEVQTNADLDLAVGDPVDLVATDGSVVTGISAHEVGANTNSDFVVVELPDIVGNDPALTNARVWVQFRSDIIFGQSG